MTSLRVLSTLAVMGAMRALSGRYEAESGVSIEADFSPTVALLERLRGGEKADIAILTAQGIDDLTHKGIVLPATRTDMALSFVGIAVKAGAARPDIGSVDAVKASLLAARSVAYSKIGASGIFFAGLLHRLGIADEVRTIVVPSGFTAERLVSNEADLAVQQVSELMMVPGIEVVGKLPSEIQTVATFSGGILASSSRPEQAAALLRFLSSPAVASILRQTGLEPA
jgi:molybdate transport system substrate-binding protein